MPYYWDPQQQISLPVPAGGVPGGRLYDNPAAFAAATNPAVGGGLFGSLFGGGQQQALPGLLNGGGGNTDALINQLLQRQIEAATQPDWGAFSAALAKAAQPGPYPKSIGAALGEAAGALSGNREQALARALQSAKLTQDLQLARRKQNVIEQLLQSEGSGGDKTLLDILGTPPAGTPLSPAGTPLPPQGGTVPAKPLIPRVTGTDETTGDLSATYGEPGTTDDLQIGGGTPPAPRPQAALTGSAREIADNNFGGLRRPGVYATPGQGGFQAFATPTEGVAAISNQLDRYASGATTGKPLTTIRQIVSTWAPPNENPTEALIARASRIVGADPDAPLDVSNPQVKAKLIEATIANEQGGRVPVARDLISRVAASNPAPTASSGVSIPPPRVDPNAWYNQPVTRSVFRDPSVDPGSVPAAERLRQSILGTLAGGSPLVNPDQSPTAAVRGGLPPQDEVIPSGRGSIPGLLRAQYTGQVNPDQSPSIQMGGQPMPPMPAIPQPQPPAGNPYGTAVPPMPSVPMPPGMDPRRLQAYMLDLTRKSAIAEAYGLPNIYGPKLQVLQSSPQYKAMQEWAAKNVELQFAGPRAAQERAATQPYILEQDAYKAHLDATNKQIEQLGAAALDPTTIMVSDGQGGQTKIGATRAQAARAYAGLAVPELGIPARVASRAGDTGSPKAGTPVGEPVYSPIEAQMGQTLGKDFTDRRGKALDSQQSIEGMKEARMLLDSPGGIAAGTFGSAQLAWAKAKGWVTGNPTEMIANTEAFLAQRARDVATEIKNFGAGTGLSDADRQYAAKIVGGDITLDEASMRKIFDIGERHHRRLIDNFNKDASKVNPKVSPYPLTVDVPGAYQKPEAPTGPEAPKAARPSGPPTNTVTRGGTEYKSYDNGQTWWTD